MFDEHGLDQVVIVKMNIGGGEYDLLPELIETGLIKNIGRLTVQFHRYSDAQIGQRDTFRRDFAKTHDYAWNYPSIWEKWVRTAVQ